MSPRSAHLVLAIDNDAPAIQADIDGISADAARLKMRREALLDDVFAHAARSGELLRAAAMLDGLDEGISARARRMASAIEAETAAIALFRAGRIG